MKVRRKLAWVAALYFAEGLPFGVVKDVLPVYFRVHDVDLTDIGLASLLGLPWTLKVLWSPLVDRIGSRRSWVTGCLLALALASAAIPLFDIASLGAGFWMLLIAFTCASATQDIAIDAYTIGIAEDGEEGDINGVRVSAYRVALIAAGGGLLLVSGWVGWQWVFWSVSTVFVTLAIIVQWLPRLHLRKGDSRAWISAMQEWAMRPGAWAIVIFILIYKVGDAAMAPMVKPFWVDRGLAVAEIGMVGTTLGVFATIAGALVGGRLTDRWGIVWGLLVLGFAQGVSNLGYAAIAYWNPPAPTVDVTSLVDAGTALFEPARLGIYSASLIESFTGGLGTAAFLAFLMRICEKRHAAVQYALLSAIFAFSRDVAGAASGWATTRLGYDQYFLMTFFMALPGLFLLPMVSLWVRREGDRRVDEGQ